MKNTIFMLSQSTFKKQFIAYKMRMYLFKSRDKLYLFWFSFWFVFFMFDSTRIFCIREYFYIYFLQFKFKFKTRAFESRANAETFLCKLHPPPSPLFECGLTPYVKFANRFQSLQFFYDQNVWIALIVPKLKGKLFVNRNRKKTF